MMFLMWLFGVWTGGAMAFLGIDLLGRRSGTLSDMPIERSLFAAIAWPWKLVEWLSR